MLRIYLAKEREMCNLYSVKSERLVVMRTEQLQVRILNIQPGRKNVLEVRFNQAELQKEAFIKHKHQFFKKKKKKLKVEKPQRDILISH